MEKKLIGFGLALMDRIKAYAEHEDLNFTKAVRRLVEIGLNQVENTDDNVQEDNLLSNPIDLIREELDELKRNNAWFNADDTQSKLGNLELEVKDLEKKLNVIVSSSKLFKKHIDNRSIHLQD